MGSYASEAVGGTEQVRYSAQRSLWGYTLNFLIGGSLVLGTALVPRSGSAIGVLLAAAAVALAWPFIARRSTELVVTDRRVIAKTGLVSRTAVELRLEKVESVRITQGLLGRLLDYGDVIVTGTGATHDPIVGISRPMRFRAELNAAIEAAKPASR